MRPTLVVLAPPRLDAPPSIVESQEVVRVQAIVPKLVVEAFDETVLHGLPGVDEVKSDLVSEGPGVHLSTTELGSVVGDDHRWVAADRGDAIENPRHDFPTSIARHSRLKSSITFSTRNLRPSANASDMKSIDHRALSPRAGVKGSRFTLRRCFRRRFGSCRPSWR